MLEFLRLDIATVKGININQITMLVVMVVAIVILIIRHKKFKKEAEQPVVEEQTEPTEKKA